MAREMRHSPPCEPCPSRERRADGSGSMLAGAHRPRARRGHRARPVSPPTSSRRARSSRRSTPRDVSASRAPRRASSRHSSSSTRSPPPRDQGGGARPGNGDARHDRGRRGDDRRAGPRRDPRRGRRGVPGHRQPPGPRPARGAPAAPHRQREPGRAARCVPSSTTRRCPPSPAQETITALEAYQADLTPIGPNGETLVELLRAPARAHPTSLAGQLRYIREHWRGLLGADLDVLLDRLLRHPRRHRRGGARPAPAVRRWRRRRLAAAATARRRTSPGSTPSPSDSRATPRGCRASS